MGTALHTSIIALLDTFTVLQTESGHPSRANYRSSSLSIMQVGLIQALVGVQYKSTFPHSWKYEPSPGLDWDFKCKAHFLCSQCTVIMALVCGLTMYINISPIVQASLWRVEECRRMAFNFVIVSRFDNSIRTDAGHIRPAGGSICLNKKNLQNPTKNH